MTVKETVKKAMLNLESLCDSYEKSTSVNLEDFEKTVTSLSREVQSLDLASDQILKKELNALQTGLLKLTSMLKVQQNTIERQVQEINIHQQALYAYARVANNNSGSLA
jgi:hypothetical protein